jgi:hypothetical protein
MWDKPGDLKGARNAAFGTTLQERILPHPYKALFYFMHKILARFFPKCRRPSQPDPEPPSPPTMLTSSEPMPTTLLPSHPYVAERLAGTTVLKNSQILQNTFDILPTM